MRQRYPGRRTLLSLLALSSLIPAFAGNIPQYKVSKGDASAKYSGFSDGTVIPCKWVDGTYALLPNGTTTPNVTVSEGYPVGFSFRFGGKMVDRFLLSNSGDIYFGKDKVTYGNNCFCVTMSPIMHGLKAGQISYKVTGTEGSRVLVIQWKNATLNTNSGYVGKYSLQLRFHESDGRIEMALKEIETPGSGNGFATSIHGWDGRDALLLTATGLDKPISVSPNYRTDMLTPSSYIKWDADDYDNGYSPVFVFTPESDKTAPLSAPTDLNVVQNGNDLEISCKKGADAASTVVLISDMPFTDADMPVDGETFRAAYLDSNGKQWYPTRLGNAVALSYLNDSEITTVYKGIDAGKTYYVRAISANGYPAYNRTSVADMTFSTSQAAPESLTATASSATSISLECKAGNPIIVASTTERVPGYNKGYYGLFGVPSADAKAGEEIEGGGKVIYVGEAGSFSAETEANAMTYFRAWTVRDGRLSSTTADCAAAPNVSFPFEPAIEGYPQGEPLRGWTALPAADAPYIPQSRNNGTENVVKAVSVNGQRLVLKTPEMELDRPLRVTFEWAMETVRAAEASEDSGDILLPKGNKPGEFGSGSLDLSAGGTLCRSVSSYDGTMTIFSGDEYIEGSSTFVPFEAEVPQRQGNGSLEISFAGDKANTSILYLRNIRVEATGEAPVAPSEAPTALAVDEDRDGFLHISCIKGADAAYTLVMVSETPITAADLPADGVSPAVGSKSGSATVIYWGQDPEVECATTMETLVTGYDCTYHVAAVSASTAPIFNRTEMAQVEYRTLLDAGTPDNMTATYDAATRAIGVTATRHPGAATTLLLVSEGEFDGELEDGRTYSAGERVGNATVIYHGADAAIAANRTLDGTVADPSRLTVTGYSCNSRGWFGSVCATAGVTLSGISLIEADSDLSAAEVYTASGIRLRVATPATLPAGLYIINGKKTLVK